MKIKKYSLIVVVILLFGCSAAVVVNDKVVGISSGKFIYEDGNLSTQFKADIELVWQAVEKAVVDLRGWNIQKDRGISSGSIKTIISDEPVTIRVNYIGKDLTSVSIFCGVVGNQMASRIIMDKIAFHLGKP
jgi:hypothetical protein